jgi:8-oxo-dGTP diphosphatase
MECIPEFGERDPAADYILRPGGYALIRDGTNRIAVVATPVGLALPGGGQKLGESSEEAAGREVLEECGLRIRIDDLLGTADELVFAKEEDMHYRKRCTFFLASIVSLEGGATEPDHQLVWMPPDVAAAKLLHGSQRWAVQQACLRWKL